jgi:hypothetical protein
MSKTPEEMAEEAIRWVKTLPPASERCNQCACEGYRAGYKAAKQEYEAKIQELETQLENWQHNATHGDDGL